ncbi:MAG: hypothetical protein KKB51_23725, partial [Candidatus Riflebacteria bacterium]|nr:hypothetical protein [Candidatus Riflebacteria bacterium]
PAFTLENPEQHQGLTCVLLNLVSGGAFISKDPIGFNGGMNLYRYADNNPMIFTDPWGLEPWSVGKYKWDWNTWFQHPSTTDEERVCADKIEPTGDEFWALLMLQPWKWGWLAPKPISIETTAHGASRLAGSAATRGGVLTESGVKAVRQAGQKLTQADGAIVRILQNEAGRFNIVIDNKSGKLITTFANLSQKSLERLARNYGWK